MTRPKKPRPVPLVPLVMLPIRLRPEQHEALKREALHRGVSAADVVRGLLDSQAWCRLSVSK